MSVKKAGGAENGPAPYTAPSEDFVPAGYFSPPSLPPSPDAPKPYRPVAHPASAPPASAPPVQAPLFQASSAPVRPVPVSPGNSPHFPLQIPVAPLRHSTGFVASTRRFFSEYGTFSGRSSRGEFWWVQLFMLLVSVAVVAFVAITPSQSAVSALGVLVGVGYFVFLAGVLIPCLALTVRRLHDANLSAGFLALVLIPSVGGIIIFILMLLPSSTQGSRFDRRPVFTRPTYRQGFHQYDLQQQHRNHHGS